ncbi:MAG: 50S ribosomal protein L9, partial [Bacteroidaceae bacterium]|nr:50S ribosomal protein L9 [Bacteroidaceae bacterium]
MEIILKEDVIGLGYKNDIVNVKSGYGRNYLIPTGKGVIASESAKKQLAEDLKQKAVKLAKIKADAEALAEKLNAVSLTIPTKV